MYNVVFLLFPKNFVSICLNSIHENYCVYMCCPIFSGSTSTPSQLSALGRSLFAEILALQWAEGFVLTDRMLLP